MTDDWEKKFYGAIPDMPDFSEGAALRDKIVDAARAAVGAWHEGRLEDSLAMGNLSAAVKAYDEYYIHWTEAWRKRNGA